MAADQEVMSSKGRFLRLIADDDPACRAPGFLRLLFIATNALKMHCRLMPIRIVLSTSTISAALRFVRVSFQTIR